MAKFSQKPELLAPAGDREKLEYAIAYGADAVYLSGEEFGLRAKCGKFTVEGIADAVEYAHQRGVKVYVTVNIYAHNYDFAELPDYLRKLGGIKPDGILVSDLGVFALAKELVPDIPFHISTQANTVNYKAAEMYKTLGARRVVLGRELSLKEIREINAKTDIELEMFVHGALCMSYSGRCLLSNYLTGRDGNRGACTHPCRWKYVLMEEGRSGEYLPVEEDDRGSYIMNSKDLNLLPLLPEIIGAGVDSLKIEGRNKSIAYVATVTKVYREAIDALFDNETTFYENLDRWQQELAKISHRAYSTGFAKGKVTEDDYCYDTSEYCRDYEFVAVVKGYDKERLMVVLEERNRFAIGEELEILTPTGDNRTFVVEEMFDENMGSIEVAPHAQMVVYLPFEELPLYGILRRAVAEK